MPRRPRQHEDRGSIPIALLSIASLLAITGALVGTTIGGSRSARFDQQYTEVVQVADAAAQEGVQHLIRSFGAVTLASRPVGHAYTGAGTLDGAAYTWSATKRSALSWEVVGSSTTAAAAGVDPVTRDVAIEVTDRSRFFVAAFSDQSFILRGGNAASSYDIDTGVYSTGNGIVGSNGTVRMNGSTVVDGVQLYNFDSLPNLSRCDGRNQTGQCGGLLAPGGPVAPSALIGARLAVGPNQTLDTQFIDDRRATCPATLPDFTASASGGVIGTVGTTTVLCVDNLTVDTNLTVRGKVEVYVYGSFSVSNHVAVNCAGCTDTSTPDSTNFLVYSAGGPVQIGNHASIAAGIYAPQSDCSGNPSNAQGQIFGSLVCRAITNQGGWNFHYDDQLAETGAGDYEIRAWREE